MFKSILILIVRGLSVAVNVPKLQLSRLISWLLVYYTTYSKTVLKVVLPLLLIACFLKIETFENTLQWILKTHSLSDSIIGFDEFEKKGMLPNKTTHKTVMHKTFTTLL